MRKTSTKISAVAGKFIDRPRGQLGIVDRAHEDSRIFFETSFIKFFFAEVTWVSNDPIVAIVAATPGCFEIFISSVVGTVLPAPINSDSGNLEAGRPPYSNASVLCDAMGW